MDSRRRRERIRRGDAPNHPEKMFDNILNAIDPTIAAVSVFRS
jgi:hypothetical protein